MLQKMYKVPLLVSLFLVLLPRNSESLLFLFHSRRVFFTFVTTAAAACGAGAGVANAGIDVSGLKPVPNETPGRAPNQPPSGPLAGTPLGFKVAGGPRPESEVRKIDEARYIAAGKGPSFLVGVPREQSNRNEDAKWMR